MICALALGKIRLHMKMVTIQKTVKGWLVVLMFGLCSCQDDAQLRLLGDQVRGLESIQAQSKAEMARLQLQMKAVQAERDKLKAERDKLQSQMDEAAKALEAIRKDFTDYKAQYKVSIRKRAPGMELEVVEFEGKKFERVRVRELTDSNLTFMHQSGTMSVPLNRLSPTLQSRLGYEKAMPVMAVTKEAASITEGVGLDQQMEEIDYGVVRLRGQLESMRRAFADENSKVQQALTVNNSDPTLHRHAAAALQVRINEGDVELAGLLKKKALLEEKLRAKKKQ
jgi:hypothetical protein